VNEKNAKKQLNVDDNQPTTCVKIKLMDGTSTIIEANENHKIIDLRAYIIK